MIYLCPASLVHSRHVGFTVHTNGSNTCNEPHITGMQSICCIFTQQSHMSSSSAKKCIRHARVQLYLIVWGGFLIGWLVCLFSLVLFVGVFSWEKPTLCDKLVILLKKNQCGIWDKTLLPDYAKGWRYHVQIHFSSTKQDIDTLLKPII